MLSNTRVGRFTSSEIYRLMAKGVGGRPSKITLSYIEEKRMELRLGRSLNSDVSARSTTWGTLLEKMVASKLDPLKYRYCSSETIVHPNIGAWAGTPDFLTVNAVVDAKCPFTMKSFCQLADISIAADVEKFRSEKPEYYWQLVSNSVLADKKRAELIVYCPYIDELEAIRELFSDIDESEQNKFAWIFFAGDADLPYVLSGGYYQNMYSFEFEVPEIDREDLISAVVEASKQLNGDAE